eukprot:CAMPEP_0180277496 /NCGR_PEP_ID=MMETSP0988-20121125/6957_1 /TAXON_ID=697907 /ORGANISM="non described non described, Strain CCMP2293" /LENGTH=60 /DNA_ID=CAMNT_0022248933 /DNA_START=590 /DNA_END=773 /DNA_ORIENTATION=-
MSDGRSRVKLLEPLTPFELFEQLVPFEPLALLPPADVPRTTPGRAGTNPGRASSSGVPRA